MAPPTCCAPRRSWLARASQPATVRPLAIAVSRSRSALATTRRRTRLRWVPDPDAAPRVVQAFGRAVRLQCGRAHPLCHGVAARRADQLSEVPEGRIIRRATGVAGIIPLQGW